MKKKVLLLMMVLSENLMCFSERMMNVNTDSYIYSYPVENVEQVVFVEKEPTIVYVDSFPDQYINHGSFTYGDVSYNYSGDYYYVLDGGVKYIYDFNKKQFFDDRKVNSNLEVTSFKYRYLGKEVKREFFDELAYSGLYEVKTAKEDTVEKENQLDEYLQNGKQWYSYTGKIYLYSDNKTDLDSTVLNYLSDEYCIVVEETEEIKEGYGIRKWDRLFSFKLYYCVAPNEWVASIKKSVYVPKFSSILYKDTMWSFDYTTIRNYTVIE